METAKLQIAKALKALGVQGTVMLEHTSFNTYRMFIDGDYFGMFDLDRNTFVD